MPQKAIDEVFHPRVAFDKVAIKTLMKPKGMKMKPEARHESTGEGESVETDQVLWRVLLQMKKDQHDF